jgi:hypothetical protein
VVHHSKVHCNYGLYFNIWDRLMGTNHQEYEREYARVTEGLDHARPGHVRWGLFCRAVVVLSSLGVIGYVALSAWITENLARQAKATPALPQAQSKAAGAELGFGAGVRIVASDPTTVTLHIRQPDGSEIPLRYRSADQALVVGDTVCELFADYLGEHRLAITHFRLENGRLIIRGRSLNHGLSGESIWTDSMLRDLARSITAGERSYSLTFTNGLATRGELRVRHAERQLTAR